MKQSSLRGWLGSSTPTPKTPLLPDANQCKTDEAKSVFASVNAAVDKVVHGITGPRAKKRGRYKVYPPEIRSKIAKTAEESGVVRAAILLQKDLGHQITTSTVQSIRDSFRKRVKSSYSQCDPQQVLSFPHEPRGRRTVFAGNGHRSGHSGVC